MPDYADIFETGQRPTSERPLLGQTLLVVEDSRFTCEALRLMCLRSGARIRRADSLRSAARHLAVYRPSVLIIDIGLPDGSGLDLLRTLARSEPRLPVILAMSGDDSRRADALAAGADDFLSKPFPSLAAFQSAILAHLPPEARPPGLRVVADSARMEPDALAYRDDLEQMSGLLGQPCDRQTLIYAARFLSGVARSAGDTELEEAAHDLMSKRSALPVVLSKLAERLATRAVV